MSVSLILIIAPGVVAFVPLSFDRGGCRILKQEPLYSGHDYLWELKGEYNGLQKKFKRLIIGGPLLILLSCIIVAISEGALHMEEGLLGAVYLLPISTAVSLFIYTGCSMGTYELPVDNKAYRRRKHGERFSWLYHVAIGCASILYVDLGMLPGKEARRTGWILTAATWLVTYGIVSGISMYKK